MLMNGEHHFNEVIFEDAFVPESDVLGQIGDGWHQVTAELGFERSGPERILSTATLIFSVIRALGDVDDGIAADVGDLVARMISLRQLSISVARALADGQDAANRAALVKDLGTRFEQDSVELVADLLDYVEDAEPLRALLASCACALPSVHAARRHERGAARCGGQGHGCCAMNELAELVDDLGRRAFDARVGHRFPESFDEALWRNLEDTGLAPADQQPGRRPGGGGDRAVRLGQTCGRGSDRRDRSARGVARGKGRLACTRQRTVDRRDRRRRRA